MPFQGDDKMIGDVDFEKILSPCYVLDETLLRRNLAGIDRVRRESGAEIIVALKACAMWSVFPELARHSDGATASSAAEARLVFEEFGAPAHTYAPSYSDADFDEICRCSSHITFNSLSQLERFGGRARATGISCGLRINPGYSPVETDLYNPALPGSRLGVERLETLPEGVEGLHFHVLCESGAEHLALALEAVERRFGHLLERAPAAGGAPNGVEGEQNGSVNGLRSGGKNGVGNNGQNGGANNTRSGGESGKQNASQSGGLKWINCGGGHLMTREGYDTELLIKTIRDFRARHPHLRVILEPGSAFTWRTGFLVAQVEDIVCSGGTENGGADVKTAMLDVSFACHMPDCLEMPYKPSIVGARDTLPGERTGYRMGGSSCLAGDWMGEWTFLRPDGTPRELRVGDRVVFEDMIHYTMVKTTMFNGVRHPSIAILRADGRLDTVRRFTYEDYKNIMS